MTRDDSTGGWVPLGGGGFSTVVLRRVHVQSSTTPEHNEYSILGQRSLDQSVSNIVFWGIPVKRIKTCIIEYIDVFLGKDL